MFIGDAFRPIKFVHITGLNFDLQHIRSQVNTSMWQFFLIYRVKIYSQRHSTPDLSIEETQK